MTGVDGKQPSPDALMAAGLAYDSATGNLWDAIRTAVRAAYRVDFPEPLVPESEKRDLPSADDVRGILKPYQPEPVVPVSEVAEFVRRLGEALQREGFENDWGESAEVAVHRYFESRFGASTGERDG